MSGDIFRAISDLAPVPVIERILDDGVDVNVKRADGSTPLIVVVRISTNLALVRFLLDRGADPNIQDNEGCSAVHWAVRRKNTDPAIMRLLLEKEGDPNLRDNDGRSPLYWAAGIEDINPELVSLLLEFGGDPNLHVQSYGNDTVVHWAAIDCSERVMKLLLDNHGDPNALNESNQTPVMTCANTRHTTSVMKLLLDAGGGINLADFFGRTALHYAVMIEDTEAMGVDMVKFLLQRGADPNIRDDEGETVVYTAVDHHVKPEIIKLLLEYDGDPRIANNEGCTPLILALQWGGDSGAATVALLLRYGAGPNVPFEGNYPLLYANSYEVAKLLLDAGADPKAVNRDRYTALMKRGARNPQMTALLIERGMNPNIIAEGGTTAYNEASEEVRDWYDDHYGPDAVIPKNRGRVDTRSKRKIERDSLYNYLSLEGLRRADPNRPGYIHNLPPAVIDRIRLMLYGRSRNRRRSRRRRNHY